MKKLIIFSILSVFGGQLLCMSGVHPKFFAGDYKAIRDKFRINNNIDHEHGFKLTQYQFKDEGLQYFYKFFTKDKDGTIGAHLFDIERKCSGPLTQEYDEYCKGEFDSKYHLVGTEIQERATRRVIATVGDEFKQSYARLCIHDDGDMAIGTVNGFDVDVYSIEPFKKFSLVVAQELQGIIDNLDQSLQGKDIPLLGWWMRNSFLVHNLYISPDKTKIFVWGNEPMSWNEWLYVYELPEHVIKQYSKK